MEAGRFDHLIRAITDRGTRRGALGLLIGTAAGVAGLGAEAGKKKKRKGKKKKPPQGTSCPGGCPAGAICSGNVCVFCATGQLACGNTCVSRDDRSNCGACGNACPSGSTCTSGVCVFCADGLTSCGNTCVNIATDPKNCGRCGSVCPTGQCANGACKCTYGVPDDCPTGCQCTSSAQGGSACSGGNTGRKCDNYTCPLGEVCLTFYADCYAACAG